jgi:hypothetical protein
MRILGTVASSSREVPGAPTIGTATDVGTARAYNNGAATVTFTAPTFDGGLPITSYTATSSPGGFTASGASSPLTVAGLASNTAYTFTVTATNARGTGSASAASNSITATTVPQAPTIGTPTCATGQAYTGSANISVAFTAGATGGKAISSYTATSSSSATGTGASSPVAVSQTVGSSYTYTVTATNANGTSTASSTSASVLAASVPQAPTIGTATAGSSSATVAYTLGATGGSAITTRTATSTPGSFTGTGTSPITVSGLTNGTAYTFKVTATNAYGTSLESAASNSITPSVPYWMSSPYNNTYAPNWGPRKVSSDSSGNSYLTATVQGILAVLLKRDTTGAFTFQRQFTVPGDLTDFYNTKTDSSGNIYLSGQTKNSSTSRKAALIMKLNSSGVIQWQKIWTNSSARGNEFTYDVFVDSSGNVYAGGGTRNTSTTAAYYFTTLKYNSSGTFQWASELSSGISGDGATASYSVATDSSGNVYSGGISRVTGQSSSGQAYLVKYNSSGTLQWQKSFWSTGGSSFASSIKSLAVDSSANIYVTGDLQLSTSPANSPAYVAKFNTSGTRQWDTRIYSTSNDATGSGLVLDSSANVYVAGQVQRAGSSYYDGFLIKFNSAGTVQWQRTFSTTYSTYIYGLAIDETGNNLFVTGQSRYTDNSDFYHFEHKVPLDGSKTGTYNINGLATQTYAASSLTLNTTSAIAEAAGVNSAVSFGTGTNNADNTAATLSGSTFYADQVTM